MEPTSKDDSSTARNYFPKTDILWNRLPRRRCLVYYNPLCTNRYFLELTPTTTLLRLLQASFQEPLHYGTDSEDDASYTTPSVFTQISILWKRLQRRRFLDYYKLHSRNISFVEHGDASSTTTRFFVSPVIL